MKSPFKTWKKRQPIHPDDFPYLLAELAALGLLTAMAVVGFIRAARTGMPPMPWPAAVVLALVAISVAFVASWASRQIAARRALRKLLPTVQAMADVGSTMASALMDLTTEGRAAKPRKDAPPS
jgi:hypothetical protein